VRYINSTSKKSAAILAYLVLALNMLNSIFLTPILLHKLGVDEYGLYQMVYSVGAYILILDLGISSVMTRFISEYRFRQDKKGEANFGALIGFFVLGIIVLIVIGGNVINVNIENIYKNLSTSDYETSHTMFKLMIFQFIVTMVDQYFQGVISAYERFNYSKVVGIIQIILSFILVVILVSLGLGAVGVVLSFAIMITLKTIMDGFYVFKIIEFKIHYYRWDYMVMEPAVGLMMAMFLQQVVLYANTVAGKTILGIMCTKRDVVIYAVANTLITFFNSLPTVFSGMFQPQVVRMVVNKDTPSLLTDLVIRVGRWQFILVGMVIAGFVLFGKDFLTLWVGGEMLDAWYIFLIIAPFNAVPLVQTICISIMNAYDKRIYRSIVLVFSSILNIIVTIFLVKLIGLWGAPIGIAFTYLIGHVIVMNIYYAKNIKLEVGRMFREIISRSGWCILVAFVLCLPLLWWTDVSLLSFVVKIFIFCFISFLLLYAKSFNKEEKMLINTFLIKIKVRRVKL